MMGVGKLCWLKPGKYHINQGIDNKKTNFEKISDI